MPCIMMASGMWCYWGEPELHPKGGCCDLVSGMCFCECLCLWVCVCVCVCVCEREGVCSYLTEWLSMLWVSYCPRLPQTPHPSLPQESLIRQECSGWLASSPNTAVCQALSLPAKPWIRSLILFITFRAGGWGWGWGSWATRTDFLPRL